MITAFKIKTLNSARTAVILAFLALILASSCGEPIKYYYEDHGIYFDCPTDWNLNDFGWESLTYGNDSAYHKVGCYANSVQGEFEFCYYRTYGGTLEDLQQEKTQGYISRIESFNKGTNIRSNQGPIKFDQFEGLRSEITFVDQRNKNQRYELFFLACQGKKLMLKFVHNDINDKVARKGLEKIKNSFSWNCVERVR